MSIDAVDPELRAALTLWPIVDFGVEPIVDLRARFAAHYADAVIPDGLPVTVEQVTAPAADGHAIPLLIFRPTDAGADRPAIFHIHGGGYVMGSANASAPVSAKLCADLGCVVTSLDYRMPPEHPHPVPLEDCYAALLWVHANALSLGIDAARIGIAGESAGGGLAAALALLARDRGAVPLAFQYLSAPMIDDRTSTTAEPHPHTGEHLWTHHHNRFGWEALLGSAAGGDAVPPYGAAARAEDLAGLPPTFISVGALDMFVDEDMDYARRLIRAGVPVELHVYPGAYHGYTLAPEARVTRAAGEQRLAWYRSVMKSRERA